MQQHARGELDQLQKRQRVLEQELQEIKAALESLAQRLKTPDSTAAAHPSHEAEPTPKEASPPPDSLPDLPPELTVTRAPPATPSPEIERESPTDRLEPPPWPPTPPSVKAGDPSSHVSPAARGDSWELKLGRDWLVRIGMVLLLTGLVFLVGFAYQEYGGAIGPGIRLFLLYLAAFG